MYKNKLTLTAPYRRKVRLRRIRPLRIFIFFIFIIPFIFPIHSTAKSKRSFKVVLSKKHEGYPAKFQKKLEHPYDISQSVLIKIMNNLYYAEKKIGRGWGSEKKVFSHSFVDKASAVIRKALFKAKSYQKVVLTKLSSKGNTICDIFVKEEILNFKFEMINGISLIHNKWEMVPKLAQRHYLPEKAVLSPFTRRYKDKTWIRVSLLEFAEEYQMDIASGSKYKDDTNDDEENNELPKASYKNNIKPLNKLERMRSLKAAYDRKLILKQEYRKKAMKLLKSRNRVKMNLKDHLTFLKLLKDEGLISKDYYDQKKKVMLENL